MSDPAGLLTLGSELADLMRWLDTETIQSGAWQRHFFGGP